MYALKPVSLKLCPRTRVRPTTAVEDHIPMARSAATRIPARRVPLPARHERDAIRRHVCRTLTPAPGIQPGKSSAGVNAMGYFFAAVAALVVLGAILRRVSGRSWRGRIARRGSDDRDLQLEISQELLGRQDTYVQGQHHNPVTHGGHHHTGGFGGHHGGGHHGGDFGGHHGGF
jgi:hypothetical protein